MSRGWWRLIVGIALVSGASVALGDAFYDASTQQSGMLTFTGFSNGWVYAHISGPYPDVEAGQFQGFFDPTAEGDLPGPEDDDFLRFFCIDISHFASGGPNPYTRDVGLPASLSAAKQAELARLFDEHYPNKTIGTYYSGGAQTLFGSFDNANDSAAFQLAVWEIFFGDGTDLANAPFTASSTAESTAQGWLTTINGESGTPPGWTFYTFTSDSRTPYQEYLSVEYANPLRELPEPGSLALFCSAVVAAGAAALRRRQTA